MQRVIIVLFGLALCWFAKPMHAAAAEMQAQADYLLTAQHGPWMIYVGSFRGVEAEQEAHKLVTELRKDYRLPAYMYNRSAKDQEIQRREIERRHNELERAYQEIQRRYDLTDESSKPYYKLKKVKVPDEYAVLVGHYADMDSARSALDKIKEKKAPSSIKPALAIIARPKTKPSQNGKKVEVEAAPLNPLARGFVVPNPLAPAEKKVVEEENEGEFLKLLNEGEPYNLLKCPQQWTLQVKVFTGGTTIESSLKKPSVFDSKRWFSGNKSDGKALIAAAAEANKLAETLRRQGLGQPYVLHTRTASIVSIGGFRGPNDPELLKAQRRVAENPVVQAQGLMFQPLPVPRPK